MRINLLLATIVLSFFVTSAQTITPEDILSIRELSDIQLSPDGKQVAFVITEPATANTQPRVSNIWVMSTEGHESPHPLVPGLINAGSPRWSPDGKTLAFLTDQIFLLRVGESNALQLTTVAGGVEDFEWSPDSKMIAFVARDLPARDELEKRTAGYDAIEIDRNL
jgi:Tol biopolymer transport system component